MKAIIRWGVPATFLLAALGCGGSGDKPKTVPVEGKVTLEGAPLEGATVSFQPVGTGRIASGLTGKDGSFRLTSFNTGDGAEPGSYKIVVMKSAVKPVDPNAMDPTKMSAEYFKMMQSTAKKPTGKPTEGEVHPNYQTADRTPLKATVPEGGIKDLVVPLKKDGT